MENNLITVYRRYVVTGTPEIPVFFAHPSGSVGQGLNLQDGGNTFLHFSPTAGIWSNTSKLSSV
jgi:hypothetical protein